MHQRRHNEAHLKSHWDAHWKASRSLFDDLWEGFDMFPSFDSLDSMENIHGFQEINFGDLDSNPSSMYMRHTNERGIF